jgi:hypothetical protein
VGPYALEVVRDAVPRKAGWACFGLAFILALTALATSGCFHYTRTQTFAASGSCSGACDHYLECKGSDSETALDSCLDECEQIFVYRGEPDRASLQDFEELDCEATIAFVDGDGRHEPTVDGRGVRRSQTHR